MFTSEYEPINIDEEREDIYRKLKDALDWLASIVVNKDSNIVYRLQAARILPVYARIMRLFLQDWEKMDVLEREVEKLKKIALLRKCTP